MSLLRKTALDQVLNVVCAQAQGLNGATASAVLRLADGARLEVKHRLGDPEAVVAPVPVAGSLAGEVVRPRPACAGEYLAVFERSQVRQ